MNLLKNGLFCFIVWLQLLLPLPLWSQKPHLIVHHYSSENGLPQNSILFLLFDKSGFLWLGTAGGIVRFDNKTFTVFGVDNIPGLQDARIRDMKIDSFGNVYATNQNYQLLASNPDNNFNSPTMRLAKENPYYFPEWGYLCENKEIGILWDSIIHSSKLPLIRHHAFFKNGDTYLVYGHQIFSIGKADYRLLKSWQNDPIRNVAVGNGFMVQFWKGGRIAVWIHDHLLVQNRLIGDISQDAAYLNGDFQTFWCTSGSFIYAGKSLYKIDYKAEGLSAEKVLTDLDIKSPISFNYLPKSNTYYFGSATDGLYVVKVGDFYLPKIPKATGSENFYAVLKLPGDTLVVKKTIIPPHGKAYYKKITNDYFVCGYVDQAGYLYCEQGYGLVRFDVKTGRSVKLLDLDEHLISVNQFQGDTLLLCTHASVYLVSKTGKVYLEHKLPIAYSDVMAKGLFKLDDQSFILLTTKGIHWYDLKTNKIQKSLLDSVGVRSVYKDAKGRLWIGSDGFGSYMYEQGEIYPLPLGPMNALKSVHSFIDDHKGHFWLPTNNGLYKTGIESLARYLKSGQQDKIFFYALDIRDGLPTNEFNGGANPNYQWLSNGVLALPSLQGLVEFNPNSLIMNVPSYPICLDKLLVDSLDVHLDSVRQVLPLKPDFNQLAIQVTCPYFGNPRNLILAYRLISDGKPGAWVSLQTSGQININRLPAGKYQVQIKKLGYDQQGGQELRLLFEVLPYFYNTWWFYSLILILFGLIGYIISRRRIRSLKRKNIEIERIVTQRTQQLQFTATQLTRSETALKQSNKVKEQLIAMILHDLRSPVRFLGTISQNMVNQFMQRSREENLGNLKKLHKSVGELWGFIEQFFGWAISQQNAFEITMEQVLLAELLEEVNRFYQDILSYNGNSLEIKSTDIVWMTDHDILSLIIRNLLDNANKNTRNGQIMISCREVDHRLLIQVKDTGKGLTPQQVQLFWDSFKGTHKKGNGSMVILQMLHRIGGELDIQTAPGEGSVFTVILKEHAAVSSSQTD